MRLANQNTQRRHAAHRAGSRRPHERQQGPEPRETGRTGATAKDINVVRGDDRPQAVRHSR
ncbi:MAG: hypothetical protein ACLGPM_04255 [Acidobacteriota bacterium]